jgi:hypothetical protein
MMKTPPKGEVTYTTIANLTPVNDGDWVKLSGEYKVTSSDNNLLIYVEAAEPTTSFHIDNFSIEIPATPKL